MLSTDLPNYELHLAVGKLLLVNGALFKHRTLGLKVGFSSQWPPPHDKQQATLYYYMPSKWATKMLDRMDQWTGNNIQLN